MSNNVIQFLRNTAQQCTELSNGVLHPSDLEALVKNLSSASIKLESIANWLQNLEVEQALIEVQDEFTHHPFMVQLLQGAHSPEVTWESSWLNKLHHYMVIRVERLSPNGHVVFEKEGARVGGKKYYHDPAKLVPNARLNWEEDKVYLVYQDHLQDEHYAWKHEDAYWTFAKELTENEALFVTKSLARVFAKAKDKKIKY